MSFSELLRRRAFWTLDSLKGKPIGKHMEDIERTLEEYNSENSRKRRDNLLQNLLKHAVESTPFYRGNSDFTKLEDFQVINKNTVRADFEAFKSILFKDKKTTPVFTSGSTGTPFQLLHNKDKRNRHKADNLYFARRGGYELGDRLYLMRAIHDSDPKSKIEFRQKNIHPYGIQNYTDEDMAKLFEDIQNDPNEKCMVCFASMTDVIVNYLESIRAKPFKSKIVKSIITDGDSLNEVTKNKMEYYFGIPVLARYGNMECGILGQQNFEGGNEYELNWASYFFEVLDLNEDIPAKTGELGRIVVTDLFNYSMPLIRYDTGDMAIIEKNKKKENGPPVFTRIEGRKVDIIWDTKGKVISPYMIASKMLRYQELKQFQFAQVGSDEYVFRLNPWEVFSKEAALIKESKGYLGNDAKVRIEYVEEVPLLSSGKRRQVVNEFNTIND